MLITFERVWAVGLVDEGRRQDFRRVTTTTSEGEPSLSGFFLSQSRVHPNRIETQRGKAVTKRGASQT